MYFRARGTVEIASRELYSAGSVRRNVDTDER